MLFNEEILKKYFFELGIIIEINDEFIYIILLLLREIVR